VRRLNPSLAPTHRAHLERRSTFWTLLVGYGGYYLCRANLGVAAPLLQSELHLDKVQIGAIGGMATLAYALGKFTLGPVADLLGGKRVFLLGMAGAVVCNLAFGASSSLPLFIGFWVLNRFAQSIGWMGLVQLVSRWYDPRQYGVTMALLSLSFLVGDVAARGLGAGLLGLGAGWRALFFVPAAVVTVFMLVARFTLRAPGRTAEGSGEASDVATDGDGAAGRLREIFLVLSRSWGFWMSCALSFLLTFLRTVFLDWTVLFLVENGTSTWKAALQSAIFPMTGAAGTLLAGWFSDRISGGRRGPVAALMLGFLVAALSGLALLGTQSTAVALVCIGASGFLLLGPYSLLAGCLALDYGGKRAAATAAGINDGVGYLGGSASGLVLGGVVQSYGWRSAFLSLAACGALSFGVALVFYFTAERRRAPPRATQAI
jgi:sugar phosphate permease